MLQHASCVQGSQGLLKLSTETKFTTLTCQLGYCNRKKWHPSRTYFRYYPGPLHVYHHRSQVHRDEPHTTVTVTLRKGPVRSSSQYRQGTITTVQTDILRAEKTGLARGTNNQGHFYTPAACHPVHSCFFAQDRMRRTVSSPLRTSIPRSPMYPKAPLCRFSGLPVCTGNTRQHVGR